MRWNTGEGYDAFLRGLAEASGIAMPTRAELARVGGKRRKEGLERGLDASEGRGREDHEDEGRPDARGPQGRRRGRRGDGRVVGVTVQGAGAGDTTTMVETLTTAAEQVEGVLSAGGGMAEVVARQGRRS